MTSVEYRIDPMALPYYNIIRVGTVVVYLYDYLLQLIIVCTCPILTFDVLFDFWHFAINVPIIINTHRATYATHQPVHCV